MIKYKSLYNFEKEYVELDGYVVNIGWGGFRPGNIYIFVGINNQVLEIGVEKKIGLIWDISLKNVDDVQLVDDIQFNTDELPRLNGIPCIDLEALGEVSEYLHSFYKQAISLKIGSNKIMIMIGKQDCPDQLSIIADRGEFIFNSKNQLNKIILNRINDDDMKNLMSRFYRS